ncbi:NAD(P)/FAD-dependent oxidoreductase [Desulfonatronum sp. SC1]|uniref:phytoene desaturase family protein n=1 Tax=Desulfonatronum sp. SC1 TaxID=2109626 RepID=UPI000D2F714C|nr:NAD(P)/FAD-dependent oxidoreductase [Desulfonatronum sp. SC1]PTN38104.1 NAD(P)/FAD-dependent oxidoreductase [Desulfonatronum sp. SC1]
MKFDHVVIGSGISGLACAVILAQRGRRVAVVEKAGQAAPLLRGFNRRGIHFDTGFHYTGAYGPGEALDVYFRCLGIEDRLTKVPYNADCFDAARFPGDGFSFDFPQGYDQLRQRLHEDFPLEKEGIDAYLRIVAEEFGRSPHLNLDLPIDAIGAFNPLHEQSVATCLSGLFGDERLRALLSLHFLLYGVEPGQASMALHAQVCGSLYQSVHGIKGGGKSLAAALTRRLEELGVVLLTGRNVKRIETASDHCRGVVLEDGEVVRSDTCIAAVHPCSLLSMVDEAAFRPATRRRFQAYEETSSGFMFSAAVDEFPKILDRKNLFLCPDMDLDGYCRPDRPIEKRPFFLAAAGAENGSSARGLILLCPASMEEMRPWMHSGPRDRPESYRSMKRDLMDRVQAHVSRSIPEIGSMTMLDCATPLTFRDWVNAPSGSLYGIKQKHGQISPSPLTKIKGLYLVGQALTGPGVLGATISAFLTCGFILGPETLRKEVRQCR